MAMEINGNFPDYSVREQNYSSYAVQSAAESSAAKSTKKNGTEKASETAGSGKARSTADYARELAKLVPSVELKVGNSYSSAKTGKTLTINPKLLEKMQNDPELEKEMKELIGGVESMTKLSESLNRASGWKTVFRHSYIDENGKYRHVALIVNEHGYKMSEKLRKERQENAEKLLERQKEKAVKRKEELQEKLEEKRAQKEDEKTTSNKAEQLLEEKITASKDGMIYLNDTEFKTIMEAVKEENAGKANTKGQTAVGANLDLQA